MIIVIWYAVGGFGMINAANATIAINNSVFINNSVMAGIDYIALIHQLIIKFFVNSPIRFFLYLFYISGGAVYSSTSTIFVAATNIVNNLASMFGGAFWLVSSRCSINNSKLSNSAFLNGGNIYSEQSLLNLDNSVLYSSTSLADAAGLYCQLSTCNVHNSAFNSLRAV